MLRSSILRPAVYLFLLLTISAAVSAQSTSADVYAIKGGTVYTVSGSPIPNGVIIIRNGLIDAVGADIAIPGDARVVDATGMTIYPGIFDASSFYGLKPPAAPANPAGANPAAGFLAQFAAGPSTVGMLPELSVTEQLQIAAETFDNQRAGGVTSALTTPREGIFQGRSAIINLGTEAPEKLLLKSPVALNIQFVTARGSFPSSLMGTFAYLRQMMLDAQHYRDEWDYYSKSPRGKTRPQHNKSLEALIPVVNGKMPVIFSVSSVREIKRAVALAEEFNLKYMIAGATQSYALADYLKSKNATVLLSLSYPQKPAGLEDPEEESLSALKDRAAAPTAAGLLHKAGVKFAFGSGTLTRPSDILVNAGRAVEAGLPKEEAIKALTIYPAQIFGLSEQLGTVEKGKIANLIVATGDLFARDTKIKYTFVDGKQFVNKAPEIGPAGPGGRPGGRRPGADSNETENNNDGRDGHER